MPKRIVNVRDGRALLDIASYARGGPGRTIRLSPAEVEQIARTVRCTPEVMVKVLSRGGQNLGAVGRHLDYLSRRGELEIETDDGDRLKGKGAEKALLEDWDLDLETHRRRADLESAGGRAPPKLVHKLMFSMPPSTPPDKLLAAVQKFAREEFGLKHRYATVLHTDEPHPHVHMVVKAVSEQGARLNIRKATLRAWRREFARHLRAHGVGANATERVVRGETRPQKRDGVYRAARRGDSTHTRERAQAVSRELLNGDLLIESGKAKLLQTRKVVETGWRAVSRILAGEGKLYLAHEVTRFVDQMPPARTEKEWLARELRNFARKSRIKDKPTAR